MDKEGFKLDVGSNSFDYMRIICACTVFLGHFLTHFQCHNDVLNFIAYFVRGVPVFFCLSGFFCVKSLQEYGCRKFIKKRFLKLYPPLWVCIILNTILIMFTYQTKPTAKEFFIYITTQFSIFQFYTGDWLRGYGVGAPNGALWTVSTELQFYFLLVLLFPFVRSGH